MSEFGRRLYKGGRLTQPRPPSAMELSGASQSSCIGFSPGQGAVLGGRLIRSVDRERGGADRPNWHRGELRPRYLDATHGRD